MDQGQQGQTGKQTGVNINIGLGETADVLVTELRGNLYEETYRGNKYRCSTTGGGGQLAAACLFSTAFSTFTPILAIYNPVNSQKNLVLRRIWCGLSASPLATAAQTGAFLLVTGVPGQTITNAQTATPVNMLTLKASGSVATGITLATLTGYLPQAGTPVVVGALGGDIVLSTATASVTSLEGSIAAEDQGGSIIVQPGQFLGIANGISNAVSGMLVTASMEWDELAQ